MWHCARKALLQLVYKPLLRHPAFASNCRKAWRQEKNIAGQSRYAHEIRLGSDCKVEARFLKSAWLQRYLVRKTAEFDGNDEDKFYRQLS
jgi:hypothetical protein